MTAVTAVSARRRHAMAAAATAVLVVQAIVRGWLGFRGSFYLDDFAFTGRQARYGLSWHYLFTAYNGHVMPGAFVWVWATTSLWPLQFGPIVAVLLVLQLGLGLTVYRLLVELFGYRASLLVLFTLYCLTPMTLPAFLWWAAALNQLPQQLAMALALLCHVRYLRTARLGWGLGGVLGTGLGLLFSEKTLLLAPLVFAFTYLFASAGRPLRRLAAAVRGHLVVWSGYVVLCGSYAVYYVLAVPPQSRQPSAGYDVTNVTGSVIGHSVAPALLGGPWRWAGVGAAGAFADPGPLTSWLSVLAVGAVAVATIAWQRRAWFGWALLAGYAAVDILLLASSRATVYGPVVGRELRYVTDLGLVSAVTLGLAVLPIHGGFARGTVQRVRPRAAVRDRLRLAARQAGWSGGLGARVGAVAVVAVALAASATVSSVRYDTYWHRNPARDYLATARTELRAAPSGLVLFDDVVPQNVAWGVLYPYTRFSRFFSPLPHPPAVLLPGRSTPALADLDRDGHLRLVGIYGPKSAPGPRSSCGWRVGTRPLTIPMQQTAAPGPSVLRLGYIANRDSTLTISAGQTLQTVPVLRGLHAVFLIVQGSVADVTAQIGDAGAAICTDDVSIGIPVPVPGSRP